jgi:hypothetical protein
MNVWIKQYENQGCAGKRHFEGNEDIMTSNSYIQEKEETGMLEVGDNGMGSISPSMAVP